MYQDSKRTCTAIVLLIKPFARRRSGHRRRRGLLKLPIKRPGGGGVGYSPKFNTGEAAPRGPTPYSLIYHFGRKGTPHFYIPRLYIF